MNERFQRDLLRGSLDLMVLSVISREPLYGYSIQKQLSHATDGQVELLAGTLYPLLHKLELEKQIRSRWDDSTGRRRKWYEITTKGSDSLKNRTRLWHRYVECVQHLLDDLEKA